MLDSFLINQPWPRIFLYILFYLSVSQISVYAQPIDPLPVLPADTQSLDNELEEFELFPVGLTIVNERDNNTTIIRGYENGVETVNFFQWQVPFREILKVLKLQSETLPDGTIELRNVGLVIRLDPSELSQDPLLGTVISVEEIENLFGVPVTFDFATYAIQLDPPWLNLLTERQSREELPIITEGLPLITAPDNSLSALSNSFTYTTNYNPRTQTSAQLATSQVALVGRLFGGSVYLQSNQVFRSENPLSQLREAQYLRQIPTTDYILGSQPYPLSRNSNGQYWGVSAIHRFGYEPLRTNQEGFSPSLRQRSDVVFREIVGSALPGTLVQLKNNVGNVIIAEVLVDESGEYRFDQIPSRSSSTTQYQLFLYPNGRLTDEPEIRTVSLLRFAEQLSPDTAVLSLSTGWQSQFENNNFLPEFRDWQSSLGYRHGINSDLTLGIGALQSNSEGLFGFTEIFYQPQNLPLKLGFNAFVRSDEVDYDLAFQYEPNPTFRFDIRGDQDSYIFQLNTRPSPRFNLGFRYDTADINPQINASFFQRWGQLSISSSVQYKDADDYRIRIQPRFKNWELTYLQDERRIDTRLNYIFSRNRFRESRLWLEAQRQDSNNNSFLGFGWRYQKKSVFNNRGEWYFDIGYRFNTESSGLVTSLKREFSSGLSLRVDYEQVSLFSDTDRLRVQLQSNLNIQPEISISGEQTDKLRNRGGLLLRPFIDSNNNGQIDQRESLIQENIELLTILDNKPINQFRSTPTSNGLLIPILPGVHRLDLDPSGYPFDTTPLFGAIAVEISAGAYTEVPIPFRPSYTVVGILTDAVEETIPGARIEAINPETNTSIFSITNSAGVYFLEGLELGHYQILINNNVTENKLIITEDSEQLLELNLIQLQE